MNPNITYWADILRSCVAARQASCTHLIVKVEDSVRGVGSTRTVDGPGTPAGRVTAPGRMRLDVDDVARWAVLRLIRLGCTVTTNEAGTLVIEPPGVPA